MGFPAFPGPPDDRRSRGRWPPGRMVPWLAGRETPGTEQNYTSGVSAG
jgi:hypothetical protein